MNQELKNMLKIPTLAAVVLAFFTLSGCVNTPTAKVAVKDDRPLIMFIGATADDMVVIDGIPMGAASDFKNGETALRIEPGTHFLKITRHGMIIFKQKFYLANGVSKTFTIRAE